MYGLVVLLFLLFLHNPVMQTILPLLLVVMVVIMIVEGCLVGPRDHGAGPGAFPRGKHPGDQDVRGHAGAADPPAPLPQAAGEAAAPRSERRPGGRRARSTWARGEGGRETGPGVALMSCVMEHRHLGRSGLKVSEIAYGNWITHGSQVEEDAARACVAAALDEGITTFDTADVYAGTRAEEVLGRALHGVRRESVEICTKVFWPTGAGPNDRGLSRKHILESAHSSLRRLRDRLPGPLPGTPLRP